MKNSVAKEIRNSMYYPKTRTYQKQPNGSIISDPPRRLYQSLKKKYLTMWRLERSKHK